MKKRLIAFCMALCMIAATIFSGIGTSLPGNADYANAAEDEYAGYVYFTTEKVTLGQGFVIEPVKVGFYEGDTLEDIVERALGDKIGYTDLEGFSYLSSIIDGGEPEGWKTEDIPEQIREALLSSGETISARTQADLLQEFDYSSTAGWMFGLNNVGLLAGAESYSYEGSGATDSTYTYADGDVLRLQFSLYGWGMDLNTWDASWGSDPLIEFPNKDELIRLVADYTYETDAETYVEAMSVLEDWDATEEEVSAAIAELETYISKQQGSSTEGLPADEDAIGEVITDVLENTTDYIHEKVSNPSVNSVGGEWAVIALARYGYEDSEWYRTYYENVVDVLTTENSNMLSSNKSTENARAIIALSALGVDPSDVDGYDLVAPLCDMDYVTRQGVNGGIYALLALDTAGYEFPETIQDDNTVVTRDSLIEYILSKELEHGGWALSGGDAAVDVTSMAIQALAPYYETNAEVKTAIDRALEALSKVQQADGGFSCNGDENAESTAQVVTALCVLGIDPEKDSDFIKNGNSAIDALLSFYDLNSHAFCHTTEINLMSTEQAAYALVAYDRLLKGQNSLYDMSDVELTHQNDTNDVELTHQNDTNDGSQSPDTSLRTQKTLIIVCVAVCVVLALTVIFVVRKRRQSE